MRKSHDQNSFASIKHLFDQLGVKFTKKTLDILFLASRF